MTCRALSIFLVLLLVSAALPAMAEEPVPSVTALPISTVQIPALGNYEGLYINEVMASNKDSLEDSRGKSPDWIEIVNTSDHDMDLTGVCLSDGKRRLDKFTFPEGTVISAGSFLIVFASDLEQSPNGRELHAAFKLSADGESLYLTKDGARIDAVFFDKQTTDISYARGEDGEFELTTTYTPGEKNIITPPED